jgi:putative DNA-invertase from lambdoid prophage Rac
MKAVAYLRVSTSDQITENQLPAIEVWCKSRDVDLVKIFRESDTAWKAGHQQELKRLLDDLRVRRVKYDYLIVWSLDRLTREGISILISLFHTFGMYGTKIISIQEEYITNVPNEFQELFLAFIGFMANLESKRRSERVKAGIKRKKEHGGKVGRKTGSKDKKRRKRSGYFIRQAREKLKRSGEVVNN